MWRCPRFWWMENVIVGTDKSVLSLYNILMAAMREFVSNYNVITTRTSCQLFTTIAIPIHSGVHTLSYRHIIHTHTLSHRLAHT